MRKVIDKIIHETWNDVSITGDNVDRIFGKFRSLRPKMKG